ncbi:MAG: hypothetical protein ACI8TP_005235 [Acidimicrobiales bacterium]|jgi:hypothetical protein
MTKGDRSPGHGVSAHEADEAMPCPELVEGDGYPVVVQPLGQRIDGRDSGTARDLRQSVDLLVDAALESIVEPPVQISAGVQPGRGGVEGNESEIKAKPIDQLIDLVDPLRC